MASLTRWTCQGASRAVPGKSGLRAHGEGERVLALARVGMYVSDDIILLLGDSQTPMPIGWTGKGRREGTGGQWWEGMRQRAEWGQERGTRKVAGAFFTTSATWEAQAKPYDLSKLSHKENC